MPVDVVPWTRSTAGRRANFPVAGRGAAPGTRHRARRTSGAISETSRAAALARTTSRFVSLGGPDGRPPIRRGPTAYRRCAVLGGSSTTSGCQCARSTHQNSNIRTWRPGAPQRESTPQGAQRRRVGRCRDRGVSAARRPQLRHAVGRDRIGREDRGARRRSGRPARDRRSGEGSLACGIGRSTSSSPAPPSTGGPWCPTWPRACSSTSGS